MQAGPGSRCATSRIATFVSSPAAALAACTAGFTMLILLNPRITVSAVLARNSVVKTLNTGLLVD
jgi:hypothetical protein